MIQPKLTLAEQAAQYLYANRDLYKDRFQLAAALDIDPNVASKLLFNIERCQRYHCSVKRNPKRIRLHAYEARKHSPRLPQRQSMNQLWYQAIYNQPMPDRLREGA